MKIPVNASVAPRIPETKKATKSKTKANAKMINPIDFANRFLICNPIPTTRIMTPVIHENKPISVSPPDIMLERLTGIPGTWLTNETIELDTKLLRPV